MILVWSVISFATADTGWCGFGLDYWTEKRGIAILSFDILNLSDFLNLTQIEKDHFVSIVLLAPFCFFFYAGGSTVLLRSNPYRAPLPLDYKWLRPGEDSMTWDYSKLDTWPKQTITSKDQEGPAVIFFLKNSLEKLYPETTIFWSWGRNQTLIRLWKGEAELPQSE